MRAGNRNVSIEKTDDSVFVAQQAQLNCNDQSLPSHVASGSPIWHLTEYCAAPCVPVGPPSGRRIMIFF